MLKPQKVGCLPPISWCRISQPSTCFHPSELQGLASSPDSKTAYSTKHRRATTAGRGPAGTREKMSNNKKEGKHRKTVKKTQGYPWISSKLLQQLVFNMFQTSSNDSRYRTDFDHTLAKLMWLSQLSNADISLVKLFTKHYGILWG